MENTPGESATALRGLGDIVAAALPDAVRLTQVAYDELSLTVEPERIIDVLTFLRDDPRAVFVSIIDITAVDYPARRERFDVVYHLLSPKHNLRIRIKAPLTETAVIASSVPVYAGADWYEREVYDLFGIVFTGHPDLRRILTDYGFEGYPLRKDFPMTGFVELRYDDEKKRVAYQPVQLPQEFRNFDFLSPWEGAAPEPLPGDEKARG